MVATHRAERTQSKLNVRWAMDGVASHADQARMTALAIERWRPPVPFREGKSDAPHCGGAGTLLPADRRDSLDDRRAPRRKILSAGRLSLCWGFPGPTGCR